MPKKVIIHNKEFVFVNKVDRKKTYVFTVHGNIYKSNYVRIDGNGAFSFVPMFGSNMINKYCANFLCDSVAMAIQSEHDVYEIDNEYELVEFINHFISAI